RGEKRKGKAKQDHATSSDNARGTSAGRPDEAERDRRGARAARGGSSDRDRGTTDKAAGSGNDPNDGGDEHANPTDI
ncbi:hypothetical protein C3R44_24180, partial [Mycobacterium tuberculosis]